MIDRPGWVTVSIQVLPSAKPATNHDRTINTASPLDILYFLLPFIVCSYNHLDLVTAICVAECYMHDKRSLKLQRWMHVAHREAQR